MSTDFDAAMRSAKNGRRKMAHTLCLSPDLDDEYRRLNEELLEAVGIERRAKESDRPTTGRRMAEKTRSTEIAEQMAALIEDNPESFIEVTLEQAKRSDWLKVRAAHPPRDNVPMDGGLFNYESFPPAAARLCLVDPEPTDERMTFLDEVLSNGEWEQLAMKVWTLNEGARDVPFSALASSILAGNASA